jgi:anti-anti-sigma regulatory factor
MSCRYLPKCQSPWTSTGILGLIASIRREGVKVSVYNPSQDVRAVFETTRLDRVVDLCEVDLDE